MFSIDPLYLIFLTTGFSVGFGHCIGMCGPIVVSFSLNRQERRPFPAHLYYNIGRITTYTLLGGILGATGAFTQITAAMAPLQKGVMILAGTLIVISGLAMADWLPLGRVWGESFLPNRFVAGVFANLSRPKTDATFFPLGLALGLLPCGPVYTALIASARSGMEAADPREGAVKGALLMLCFGIGTLPALILVARLAAMGWLKSRSAVYRIGAVLMIAVGIYYVVRAIRY